VIREAIAVEIEKALAALGGPVDPRDLGKHGLVARLEDVARRVEPAGAVAEPDVPPPAVGVAVLAIWKHHRIEPAIAVEVDHGVTLRAEPRPGHVRIAGV
jgi:hypothetical protein